MLRQPHIISPLSKRETAVYKQTSLTGVHQTSQVTQTLQTVWSVVGHDHRLCTSPSLRRMAHPPDASSPSSTTATASARAWPQPPHPPLLLAEERHDALLSGGLGLGPPLLERRLAGALRGGGGGGLLGWGLLRGVVCRLGSGGFGCSALAGLLAPFLPIFVTFTVA